ncbi:hypothetical protein CRE_17425 [Caenorhabditis remanei]|uniref:DUF38 domain-containing protein n=1 Tax=Caenorhabditis remanei TaxID=31234 RepID=E3N1Z8_CAERE|nr:hypothetical protein CRE_17425 [Caenorhabditis remanei]
MVMIQIIRLSGFSMSILAKVLQNFRVNKSPVEAFEKCFNVYLKNDDAVSNKTTVSIFDSVSGRLASDINVNKSFEEVFEKCFNVFLNGSNIQDVGLYHVPKFLCETDRSDGFKLNISNLITNCVIGDKFDSFIRFVNLDNLEHISLSFDDRRNQSEEQFMMLEKPAIINCKGLDLIIAPPVSPINYYTGLRNQTLVLDNDDFHVDELRMLIELQVTFPVEIPGGSTDKPGIGIRIDDKRDLVLYNGEYQVEGRAYPSLKMEVIASGSEKKNGDSEPDVSA